MPRYFFDLCYGPDMLSVDPEGDEFPDDSSARAHALHAMQRMIRTRSHVVRDWMTCSFEVMDQDQRLVCTVPFTAMAVDAE